jgi:phosphatidylglycerol---prolipoprotein diacylglyceryl transferase
VHKVAFSLGGFQVYWYGVLVATGFLAGLWTASRRGLRDGIRAETILDVGPWLLLGAVVGSRALYVINNWQADFAGKPWFNIVNLRQGGLVFYGGLIGAASATIVYLLVKKLPVWKLADALAPSIALGACFGRLGCFMNGCCYGQPTSLPWAVHFPAEHETRGAGVHPVQLYDSFGNLGLYLFLAWLYRRKTFDGQVFAAHLLCYAVLRSFVERFRNDYGVSDYFLGGLLTPGQFISIGILAAGAILYWRLKMSAKKAG